MTQRFSLAYAQHREAAFDDPQSLNPANRFDFDLHLPWAVRLEPVQKYRWFIGRVAQRIESLGLRLSVQHDFEEFTNALAQMENYIEYVTPAFDPGCNDLHRERSFWLRVDDPAGRMVACIAGKVFKMLSLYPHIANLSIWYDSDPTVPHEDEAVEMISDTSRRIGGTVSMTGRLWTHPAWRNRGLSSYLPLLARTMLLAKHQIDYHFGLVSSELVAKNVPILRYGFPRVEKCLRAKPRGADHMIEIWMVWMSQAEIIADVDDAVSDN
jgi:hypothetical protein